jgi:pyrimidine operon attenuation protein / uracil phosphoribosyltransferase
MPHITVIFYLPCDIRRLFVFKRGENMDHKAKIMTELDMERALKRIAHEIIENCNNIEDLYLVGIQRRGVPISQRIAKYIKQFEGVEIPTGILDITFYRDDLSLLSDHPVINGTDVPFSIQDKTVVMIDDVLYTGRTGRAAIDALMDMGRPKCIKFAVMVDRGHRELPIRADFVGKNVPTSKNEIVHVMVEEMDGRNEVVIDETNK